ncbi:MAG: hypothetical protein GF329_11265 [Candidatus Lokiarchaeota archaeon]|nr:hypothetical protein [Candidatus Lokiarchaeota archaeon]
MIFEVGIISNNGINLVSKTFNEFNFKVKTDEQLKTGLLSALVLLAESLFDDSVPSLRLKKYKILMFGLNLNRDKNIKEAIYCICDFSEEDRYIKESMQKTLIDFLSRYGIKEKKNDITFYHDFKKQIEKNFQPYHQMENLQLLKQ